MLAALRERFNLREENDLFGDEMLRAIKQAKIVINLHYYENALLEMPRIQECLSLGVPVVSEASSDQGDYPELGASVTFFEPGSIPAMLDAVQKALQSESASAVAHSQAASQQRFAFMFDRFLVASGLLSSSYASSISCNLPVSAHTVALSMPESFNRRSAFVKVQPQGCVLFDGIRRTPGWIGCGLSYKTLALRSLALGHTSLTIMEDDVVLPSDYSQRLAIIHEFLESPAREWDVFSGLIASLHPNTEVLNVENFGGYTFVTLNKMTSMVFNIYRRPALEMLAAWDPENRDVRTNTIDRWLESRPALRVVVMLPYLVDHREEAQSTLWHFDNSCYTNMISRSQGQLREKVAQFQQLQIDR
jgi:hypothetical protein